MTLVNPKPGGYATGERLPSAHVNTANNQLPYALDGNGGGSYAPSSPLIIGGAGIETTVTPTGGNDVPNKAYVDAGDSAVSSAAAAAAAANAAAISTNASGVAANALAITRAKHAVVFYGSLDGLSSAAVGVGEYLVTVESINSGSGVFTTKNANSGDPWCWRLPNELASNFAANGIWEFEFRIEASHTSTTDPLFVQFDLNRWNQGTTTETTLKAFSGYRPSSNASQVVVVQGKYSWDMTGLSYLSHGLNLRLITAGPLTLNPSDSYVQITRIGDSV